ncbi:MAG: hypothetical protein LRY62_02555 [Alphaproteobacteria bacterium]|nr:hypothetical protein [Alphaproteobacteria bacterium]
MRIISKSNKPLFLVLAAYEPSLWKVDIDDDAQVAGVLVSGYYEQEIQGVSGNIRVVNYSLNDLDYALKFYGTGEKRSEIKMKKSCKLSLGQGGRRLSRPR